MPRFSPLAGFRDPVRRPRLLVWCGVALIGVIGLVVVALGVTSSFWFCANGCHAVQDDTILAYQNSSHDQVSCMACHMPVNSDPVTFLLHKATALGELYMTATGSYELPLNAESELSGEEREMPEDRCTQCHSKNRLVTPSEGILIDHEVHEKNHVTCAMCHNRVAHNEDGIKLTLKGNRKHEDFMKMDGCFRCHTLKKGGKAPGDCTACHTPGFELKPENHEQVGFYEKYGNSKKHAKLAKDDAAAVKAGHAKTSYCEMCHVREEFCDGCHGVPMPHPADFSKGHGGLGKKNAKACANCHATAGKASASGTRFCDNCHHKQADPKKPWIEQHFDFVRTEGAQKCFKCHSPTYCSHCHVNAIAGGD